MKLIKVLAVLITACIVVPTLVGYCYPQRVDGYVYERTDETDITDIMATEDVYQSVPMNNYYWEGGQTQSPQIWAVDYWNWIDRGGATSELTMAELSQWLDAHYPGWTSCNFIWQRGNLQTIATLWNSGAVVLGSSSLAGSGYGAFIQTVHGYEATTQPYWSYIGSAMVGGESGNWTPQRVQELGSQSYNRWDFATITTNVDSALHTIYFANGTQIGESIPVQGSSIEFYGQTGYAVPAPINLSSTAAKLITYGSPSKLSLDLNLENGSITLSPINGAGDSIVVDKTALGATVTVTPSSGTTTTMLLPNSKDLTKYRLTLTAEATLLEGLIGNKVVRTVSTTPIAPFTWGLEITGPAGSTASVKTIERMDFAGYSITGPIRPAQWYDDSDLSITIYNVDTTGPGIVVAGERYAVDYDGIFYAGGHRYNLFNGIEIKEFSTASGGYDVYINGNLLKHEAIRSVNLADLEGSWIATVNVCSYSHNMSHWYTMPFDGEFRITMQEFCVIGIITAVASVIILGLWGQMSGPKIAALVLGAGVVIFTYLGLA